MQGFPGTYKVRLKTGRNGGGLRARWKDQSGAIYEWDYQHGRFEKYDKRGRHVGEFSYPAGKQTGGAINTRRVDP